MQLIYPEKYNSTNVRFYEILALRFERVLMEHFRVAALLLFLMPAGFFARAEDVPLESCDRLPVVQVSVSGVRFMFLVDTAATSMLNVNSFSHGNARPVTVTSWSGTVTARAKEIRLAELSIGEHRLKDLRLPAIDLSSIGEACGRKIDGILGVDLLSRLGATVDLKHKKAHLDAEEKGVEPRISSLHRQLAACEEAFNHADKAVLAGCLDPQIVIFTAAGVYHGRDAALDYYERRYVHFTPNLSITPRGNFAIGDAVWLEYDLRIDFGGQTILAHGAALCRDIGGKWRILHMSISAPTSNAVQAKKRD